MRVLFADIREIRITSAGIKQIVHARFDFLSPGGRNLSQNDTQPIRFHVHTHICVYIHIYIFIEVFDTILNNKFRQAQLPFHVIYSTKPFILHGLTI